MKKRIISAVTAAAIALTLSAYALAAGAGGAKYINTRAIASNLSYANTVYWNDAYGREESYALRCVPGGDAYPIVAKDDTVYGGVTIGGATAYAGSVGKNVLAAINADFFSTATGVPLGMVIEDGIYKSSPEGETAVAFRADGTAFFSESPRIVMTLTNNGDGLENANAGKTSAVTHLNKMRHDVGGMYMFSEAFSTVSTRATTPGWYVRFEILEGALTVEGEMKLVVTEAAQSEGAVTIGEGNLVLTASGAPEENFQKYAVGDYVTLTTTCDNVNLREARWATGGGDIIVKDGVVSDFSQWDKALLVRSPKTALGVTADGTVLAYVIDGRDTTYANGVTLFELADELIAQGCVTAINLDGGGSSAMSVRLPGTGAVAVVNRPSDGTQRKCSTYILFVTDNLSDGVPRNLSLANNGNIVLAGSSFELAYASTDLAYKPVAAPGDIQAASYGLGGVSGSVYTAGNTAGIDKIELYSPSTGAVGTGEVTVLTNPTSVTAYSAAGKALTEVNLAPGASLTLAPVATYYRKAVTAQPGSFAYAVIGDIGTITPDGVFTASELGNRSGEITVTAGTQTATVKVTVKGFADTAGHWAKEFIDELYTAGIVGGVTDALFAPESEIKRCDFILMLYRAAGQPAPVSLEAFTDVVPDAYYAAAVAWAKESGVTTGVGDGQFDPLSTLTREQAFAFVYRALNLLKITLPEDFAPTLDGFADALDVSEYAAVPSAALVYLGVVGGDGGKLNPKTPLTRAQMAKILCVTLRLAA